MSWKPPKEFGGVSAQGLAQLRGLDLVDLPFAKSITPEAQAYRANGFDSVRRAPTELPVKPGLFVSEGRRAFDTGSHIALSPSAFSTFVDLPVSVTPGIAGGMMYAGRNEVLLVGYDSADPTDGTFSVFRTTDFKTKAHEFTAVFATSSIIDTFTYVTSLARVDAGPYSVLVGNEYEPSIGSVFPACYRRTDRAWGTASTTGYPTYDHYNPLGLTQIAPSVQVGCWGVFARQTAFAFVTGTRPNSPTSVPTPYPLLLSTRDAGHTYGADLMDPLLSGCTTAWQAWDTGGVTTPVPGASFGGFEVAQSFVAAALRSSMMYGFSCTADAGPEFRMWFVADVPATADLCAGAVQVTTPPGFRTTWRFLLSGFSNVQNNAIVFVAAQSSVTAPTAPKRLLITTNNGASWIDRPMPWAGLNTGMVRPLTSKLICAVVYDPIKFGTQLYLSGDLGATWKAANMVATNTRPPNTTEGFQDYFGFEQMGLTPEGLEPLADPMAAYVYDFHYTP